MEQGYRDEPPADDQHRVSHLYGTAVDDQVDDQQEAENGSDDQRSRNDLAPPCGRLEMTREVFDGPSSSITVSRSLQLQGERKESAHAA